MKLFSTTRQIEAVLNGNFKRLLSDGEMKADWGQAEQTKSVEREDTPLRNSAEIINIIMLWCRAKTNRSIIINETISARVRRTL